MRAATPRNWAMFCESPERQARSLSESSPRSSHWLNRTGVESCAAQRLDVGDALASAATSGPRSADPRTGERAALSGTHAVTMQPSARIAIVVDRDTVARLRVGGSGAPKMLARKRTSRSHGEIRASGLILRRATG